MARIQHIQEDRHYNLQRTSDDITKAAYCFEVFFVQHKISGVQTK
jgi:hypothetical protein